MHINTKKNGLSYVWLYLFAFCAIGTFTPLIGQYLSSINFTGTQIGTITSAGTASAIVASAFWGKLYKKSENKKHFIFRLLIAAAFFCVSLYFVNIYTLFLLMFCVLYFFQAPAMALIDAMTVEDGKVFGDVRKWGAVGFALGVFIAGRIAAITGLSVIFFIYSGCFIISAAIVYMMSRVQRSEIADSNLDAYDEVSKEVSEEISKEVSEDISKFEILSKKSGDALYRNRKYVKLVVCAFFINGTITANNTYFGFLFVEGGGNIAGIGLAFLLMAGSEAPFMAWADKLAKMFTLEKTLLAAISLSVIRFAWYATCPSSSLLIGLFVLQGMTTGIIIVEFVRYVAKVVSRSDLGFAISIYYALGSGLSGIFCQMSGGIILDHFNAGGVYVFFAIMNMIGAAIYIVGKLYKNNE